MSRTVESLLCTALVALFAANCLAQTSSPAQTTTKSTAADQKTKTKSTKDTSEQLEAMQGKLDQAQTQIQQQQSEIEGLRRSLQDNITALQQQQKQLQSSVQKASEQASVAQSTAAQADVQFTNAKSSFVSLDNSLRTEDDKVRDLENPKTIHYKGVTLTPLGFFETSALVRTRNENADLASSWTNIPLNGSSNSKLSEFRGTVRHTRLGMLVEAHPDSSTKLTGYIDWDFMGAAPTANYVQSSAWTPRLRQAWFQIAKDSGWTFSAGQFYSLLVTNRKGLNQQAEWIPKTAEDDFVVGYTLLRERSVRIAKDFHNGIWAGFEVDDPENTYSAAFVPANLMGLNTSQNTSSGVSLLPFLANYSNGVSTTRAPDFLGKVVFEPGWGHFEIKALGRIFRDRIASTATTTGNDNYTQGYGFGFAALMPVVRQKLDIEFEGFVGQGIGRYGATSLPDVTLNPVTGAMKPLRDARFMGGIEYHPNSRLDLYAYGGNEYVGRYAYTAVNSSGETVPAGYGSPLVSYAACTNEVALNTCNGANRDIYEVTVGYWRRVIEGEFGKLEYGNQVEYMHRNLWRGVPPQFPSGQRGRTPQGGEIVIFSTARWYLP